MTDHRHTNACLTGCPFDEPDAAERATATADAYCPHTPPTDRLYFVGAGPIRGWWCSTCYGRRPQAEPGFDFRQYRRDIETGRRKPLPVDPPNTNPRRTRP